MDPISTYFAAERAESALFIALGLLALGVAAHGWFVSRRTLLRGAAWPLAAVALIQLGVGASIWQRSPQDVLRVQQIVLQAPQRVRSEEIPRMQHVMDNFVRYRWIEIGLLAAGVLLAAVSARGSARRGAGLGLALQAGLMLALDHLAEARGAGYLAWLTGL